MQECGKTDVYYKALVYIFSICPETRRHFKRVFDLEKGEINVDSLGEAWQTGSSKKVTRMAFSLWNECNYDSIEDFENGEISRIYNPSEIFSCGYAPYFYEEIKLRYPEYTMEKVYGLEME